MSERSQRTENDTCFDISLEGVHKWIAFVASKSIDIVGLPNRYSVVIENGTLKLHSFEARSHDSALFFPTIFYESRAK
jgi:hypothetical protein